MPLPTLLDISKSDAGILYPLIEESVVIAPELSIIPAETIVGNTIELTVRESLPVLGFRNFNEGSDRSKSGLATKVFQVANLGGRIVADRDLVDAAKDSGRYLENEVVGFMQGGFKTVGSQFYYGKPSATDKGFPGLIAQYPGDTDHFVDATGTGNAKSSVWFICVGRNTASFLFGNNRTLSIDPWRIDTVLDANSKEFPAYNTYLRGGIGLRLANKHAAVRIGNLTAAKPLTDALMFQALQKMTDLGLVPTHIFANGRSLEQLRSARTATNATGAPAPLPRDFEGIPIIRTNSIINGETV